MGESRIMYKGNSGSVLSTLLVLFVVCSFANNVYVVHDDNYEALFARHTPMITYFDSKDATPELESFLESLTSVGSVGFVNCRKSEDPCLDHKISKKKCPALGIVNDKSDNFYAGDMSDFDAMTEWTRSIVLGKVVPITTLEETEQLQEGSWIVKFYAPWCGHCKKLAPVWTAASNVAVDEMKFAKIDCTNEELSDFCQTHEVAGYPTIIGFKDGETFKYEGDRQLAAILKWGHETFDIPEQ